jgi:hypothetical protein
MALIHSLEKNGNILFKYRGQIPVVLFLLSIPTVYFTDYHCFNDNSTLTFCTVSPSSASNVKPNALPFIGQPNQQVIITNTFFNPMMLEIEMVQYDIETLAFALFGNQSKSLEDGIYTIYNFNNDIYKQYDLYEIKDRFSGKPLFEIREQRNSIDFNKTFTTVTTV